MVTKMPGRSALTDTQLAEVIGLVLRGAVAAARHGGCGGAPTVSLT